MYTQITTRCNMHCEHCCSRCEADGEDMSMDIFKKALEIDSEAISIGGGEPTIHPQFWEMLGYAIGHCYYVWLATNGKETDTALSLAKLAEKEVIGCELSQDEFHECIDDGVIKAFTRIKSIRDVTRGGTQEPVRVGRYMDNFGDYEEGERRECVCSDFIVKPNGNVYACGCDNSPKLGNIMDNNFNPQVHEDYEWGECWNNQQQEVRDSLKVLV